MVKSLALGSSRLNLNLHPGHTSVIKFSLVICATVTLPGVCYKLLLLESRLECCLFLDFGPIQLVSIRQGTLCWGLGCLTSSPSPQELKPNSISPTRVFPSCPQLGKNCLLFKTTTTTNVICSATTRQCSVLADPAGEWPEYFRT